MKALPIGKSDFKKLIEEDCYYVDKTGVIEELLTNKSEIALFPRPRRFGKTLLLSMLYNFFEVTLKEENKNLFKNLNISKSKYYSELNTYPTIFISFKDVKSDNFELSYLKLKREISNLYLSKEYIMDVLNEKEKEEFIKLRDREATFEDYNNSLKTLSNWLERYHNKKVVVLIDEYDAPINESYINGYYKDLMNLIQPILSSTLKDNTSLKLGIVTGVLRIGGESLFSSFNNPKVYDIMSEQYNEYFGFTKEETKELLHSYGLELTEEVDDYYDGYKMGSIHIYNPWSILNYAQEKELKPYWLNTGSNKLLKELYSEVRRKENIEKLLTDSEITFRYDSSMTYSSIKDTKGENNLLNLLLVLGYITYSRSEIDARNTKIDYFKIPNREVKEDLVNIINSIVLEQDIEINDDYRDFLDALESGETEVIEEFIKEVLLNTSYHDFPKNERNENPYQLFTTILFSFYLKNRNYIVKSNRESGKGRSDIYIVKKDLEFGCIIEIKDTANESEMESLASIALNQIKEMHYLDELEIEKIKNIQKYAIVYCGKNVLVRK